MAGYPTFFLVFLFLLFCLFLFVFFPSLFPICLTPFNSDSKRCHHRNSERLELTFYFIITGAQRASAFVFPLGLVPCHRTREIALRSSGMVQALRVQWVWFEGCVWHIRHLVGCGCSGAWHLTSVTRVCERFVCDGRMVVSISSRSHLVPTYGM